MTTGAFAATLARLREVVGPRTVWLAGTRGEALCLGPLWNELKRMGGPTGYWLATSEHGMALHQALDRLEIIPHETAPQCHPAEEPAQRLAAMLSRAEACARQRHATSLLFTGWGPTAVGGALLAHARGAGGVWLRPQDPAGLARRLRWEAGNERLIRALGSAVEVIELPGLPWLDLGAAAAASGERVPPPLPPGFNPALPVVLIAILRREWGLTEDRFTRLARRAAEWARARPDRQFALLSLLNARLERPFRSLEDPPANLWLVPPLPWPEYASLLDRSAAVLTDSISLAAEALRWGKQLATLAETPAQEPEDGALTWDQLEAPGFSAWF